MDSTTTIQTSQPISNKSHILPSELNTLFNYHKNNIKVLSLDCFDTLIWRKAGTPTDVFYDLYQLPMFNKHGLSAPLRTQAEEKARQINYFKKGSTEVTLRDIYLAHDPTLDENDIDLLTHEELATEISTCYAFPPVIELMRNAKINNIQIIIVSDTYFTEMQLRQILKKCLPNDVYESISHVFCSSEYGKGKNAGIFHSVHEAIKYSFEQILHIGDHIVSDFAAPQALGIRATQLHHYNIKIGELLRMRALSGSLLDHDVRHKKSLANPFRGIFSAYQPDSLAPETIIGYYSLGPIMYAFSNFIVREIDKLKSSHKQIKTVFLMRDGYLPFLSCEALSNEQVGKKLRISRFVSYAASFRSIQDIEQYLIENVGSFRFYEMCKQLLITNDETDHIIKALGKSKNPALDFLNYIKQTHVVEKIIKRSKSYRNRLYQYLRNEIDLQEGDTIVLVDLGYTGTTQNKLSPILMDELNVNVVGRYLISLRTPGWEKNRSGLIDGSWCDDRTMQTLIHYIALLEQVCTTNEKSVIDYDEHGHEIFSDSTISKVQHHKLDVIQQSSLRFILDAKEFYRNTSATVTNHELRDVALSEIGRLIYFPSDLELDYLKSFKFDVNLGTKDTLTMFDPEKGLTGLKRRGLFFMEKNLKSMRTNYPAELRYAGMDLSLFLMLQHRINFDARVSDMSLRREALNVIAIKGGSASQNTIEAMPTYDGYFSLIIPVGNGEFQVGIQFGLQYQLIQLESAELIMTNSLYTSKESEYTEDAMSQIIVEQMRELDHGLFSCESLVSLLIYVPNNRPRQHHQALRIIFRPISYREDSSKA